MCGIVVVHDPNGPDAAFGRRMLDRISHRGPDGNGSRLVGSTWLGHVRLSIVDLDAGAQPLPSGEGHWAVVNGEIYNHVELREASSRAFRTDSDSEAALAAAIVDDPEALGDLRGMFAFAVADEHGRLVVGLRSEEGADLDGVTWAHLAASTVRQAADRVFATWRRGLRKDHRESPDAVYEEALAILAAAGLLRHDERGVFVHAAAARYAPRPELMAAAGPSGQRSLFEEDA